MNVRQKLLNDGFVKLAKKYGAEVEPLQFRERGEVRFSTKRTGPLGYSPPFPEKMIDLLAAHDFTYRVAYKWQKVRKKQYDLAWGITNIDVLEHLLTEVGINKKELEMEKFSFFAGGAQVMNERQEKDIIRTLCKAGHEALAKTFARSRGYRVTADDQDVGDFELVVMHRGMPAPKKMPFMWLKDLSGKSAKSQVYTVTRKARLTIAQMKDFATRKAAQDLILSQAQKAAGKGRYLISVKLVVMGGRKGLTIANWDPWNNKWVTPDRLDNAADAFQREAFEVVKSGIPHGYYL